MTNKTNLDIGSNYKRFFDTFGLKYRPMSRITLKQREGLELIWTTKYYEDDTTGTYELTYYSDQWFACSLYTAQQELYRGEGDSSTIALMALCIIARDLMDDNDIQFLYDLFGRKE